MATTSPWKENLAECFFVWVCYFFVSGFAISLISDIGGGKLLPQIIVATAVVLSSLLIGAVSERSINDVIVWAFAVGAILCVGLFTILFIKKLAFPFVRGILTYTVWNPLISLTGYVLTVPYVVGAIVLGLVGVLIVGSLFTASKTGPEIDWTLTLRMVASPLVLAVLLIGFFTAIWRIIELVVRFVLAIFELDPVTSSLIATVIPVTLIAAFVLYELYHFRAVEQHEDAIPVTSNEYPHLHSTTIKVAAQLDVPMPTIAVSERSEPEAITVGYRPGKITLILSQGILDTLDDEELESVVAHELAHVANMDAMVMTIASLPSLLAGSLATRALALGLSDEITKDGSGPEGFVDKTFQNARQKGPQNIVWFALLIIAVLTKIISLPAVNALSRARESAADRTAATVTGSPAALASALRTLTERIDEMPSEDLREASNLASLSILPLDPIGTSPTMQESEGVVELIGVILAYPFWIFLVSFFGTHPSTNRRIDVLTALEEEQ